MSILQELKQDINKPFGAIILLFDLGIIAAPAYLTVWYIASGFPLRFYVTGGHSLVFIAFAYFVLAQRYLFKLDALLSVLRLFAVFGTGEFMFNAAFLLYNYFAGVHGDYLSPFGNMLLVSTYFVVPNMLTGFALTKEVKITALISVDYLIIWALLFNMQVSLNEITHTIMPLSTADYIEIFYWLIILLSNFKPLQPLIKHKPAENNKNQNAKEH